MPELPEVETVMRDLHPCLVGRTFTDLSVYWAGTIYGLTPEALAMQLVGRRILDLSRRGKYIIMTLSEGQYLLLHLRMSGQLFLAKPAPERQRHVRLVFHFDDGSCLSFVDQRKFGRVYLTCDPAEIIGKLGPEPLGEDLTPEVFADAIRRRKGLIKPLLLNQFLIAGIGNIYADEALFAAGIHPCRRAHTLTPEEISRLYQAVREVLEQGIANHGTTLNKFSDAHGRPGSNQGSLAVFQRTDKACPRCGAPIERLVVGGRGTHYCARCQR